MPQPDALGREEWRRVRQVFEAACDADGSERARILDEQCAGDERIRREVEKLLAAEPEKQSFLATPVFSKAEGLLALAMASGAAPEVDPLIGATLKDRFAIERTLGQGGFGTVYLAHDLRLHSKPVVVKVIDPGANAEWMLRRFRLETEALAKLDHPGIVGVLDADELADGRPFLIMPFIDGVSLRDWLDTDHPLARKLDLLGQMSDALAAAHSAGVWHRDLKPENILIRRLDGEREQAVLIDFGIATVCEGEAPAITTAIVGSRSYMAPEQLIGKPCAQTDVFALGAVAFEMLTGEAVVHVAPTFQISDEWQAYSLPFPEELSAAARSAVLKALRHRSEDRFPSPREFAVALTGDAQPSRRRWLLWSGAGVLAAVPAAIVALRPRSQTGAETGAPPALPGKLAISVLRDDHGRATPVAPGARFHAGDRIRLSIDVERAGALYALNQSPEGRWLLLWPGPAAEWSSQVAAASEVVIPARDWIEFDRETGTEIVWAVWSEAPVHKLEEIVAAVRAGSSPLIAQSDGLEGWLRSLRGHPSLSISLLDLVHT